MDGTSGQINLTQVAGQLEGPATTTVLRPKNQHVTIQYIAGVWPVNIQLSASPGVQMDPGGAIAMVNMWQSGVRVDGDVMVALLAGSPPGTVVQIGFIVM